MLAIILNRLRKAFFDFQAVILYSCFLLSLFKIYPIPVAKTITTKDMNSITPQQEFPLEFRFFSTKCCICNKEFTLKKLGFGEGGFSFSRLNGGK